ncbi:hypothetical protein BN971_00202 [Mycobacterium bohemicum DSM 44277]|uniref:Uncharacterized protein n=1 Tax=Mycobacterium bohemicum DSM 44277 TaxID=1236609 RepID=A0A0U0W222_MYCBE|nr:hypothetical protein BN971_00202 [Mycobacterium bohemicum DSM 44277]
MSTVPKLSVATPVVTLFPETAAHGATIVSAVFTHTSLQHYLENLHALAELGVS